MKKKTEKRKTEIFLAWCSHFSSDFNSDLFLSSGLHQQRTRYGYGDEVYTFICLFLIFGWSHTHTLSRILQKRAGDCEHLMLSDLFPLRLRFSHLSDLFCSVIKYSYKFIFIINLIVIYRWVSYAPVRLSTRSTRNAVGEGGMQKIYILEFDALAFNGCRINSICCLSGGQMVWLAVQTS